jgi:hypothetical protein
MKTKKVSKRKVKKFMEQEFWEKFTEVTKYGKIVIKNYLTLDGTLYILYIQTVSVHRNKYM